MPRRDLAGPRLIAMIESIRHAPGGAMRIASQLVAALSISKGTQCHGSWDARN
jgi:hypothetical protein